MVTSVDLFTGLIAVLVSIVLYAVWRVWVTLVVLEPVVARLAGSDYREADRNFDRSVGWLGSGNESHGSLIDDETRLTDSYWHYTDAAGDRHEVTLSGFLQRGAVPDATRVLWIDPAEPANATRFGPGYWSLWGTATAAALGWLLPSGPQALAGLSGAL